MSVIVTTRFTTDTWRENANWRKIHNHTGCIYGEPRLMCSKIPANGSVFVIEMNNTDNRIEGIGLLLNNVRVDKYYKIHQEGNYNRFTFKGKYRLDRSLLLQYNSQLVLILDEILFKGRSHMKRYQGITSVPHKLLVCEKSEGVHIHNEIKRAFISLCSCENKTDTV
jgi:hypothetical protein